MRAAIAAVLDRRFALLPFRGGVFLILFAPGFCHVTWAVTSGSAKLTSGGDAAATGESQLAIVVGHSSSLSAGSRLSSSGRKLGQFGSPTPESESGTQMSGTGDTGGEP
jgi:hypothetical protein